MIYELRLYAIAAGRMADVHDRFNHHFPALFAKHGVDCVARWVALAGPDAPRFVYMMAYRDYAHREAVWASFYQDAEWWRVRAETNAGHEIVERPHHFFMKPNAAWVTDAKPDEAVGGLHELVQQQIAPGQSANANAFLKEQWLPLLHEAGARVLGVFDVAAGSGMPKIVLMHAWRDAAAFRCQTRCWSRPEFRCSCKPVARIGQIEVAPLLRIVRPRRGPGSKFALFRGERRYFPQI